MEKYITYRVIAATGSQQVEQIVEISNNTEVVDTAVNLSYDAPSRTIVNSKGTDANLPIANGDYGLSKNNLTDVRLARLLAAPEILYVLREPVTVTAPIAAMPFIAATIPLPQGSLGNQNVDVRIEGAIRKVGGTIGYDLYISSSRTSLINGGKIATILASAGTIGTGILRTFKFYTNGDIQGYNFENAQPSDTISYSGNAQSIQPWAGRSVDRYIHVVATATATTASLRVTQLSATKLSPPPPPPSNDRFFDVRMDWEGDYGVTDQQTFLDTFQIEVENFVMLEDGDRIQCDYISGVGVYSFQDGVIFSLPRISWEELSATNTSFGVEFVFPDNLFSLLLLDYPDSSIPTLPTDVLDVLSVVNAPNLTSFPDLPPTVNYVEAQNCALIGQVAIDKLATEFLQGDLPKDYWDSSGTIEPSAALKQQIQDNTTTSQF